MSRKQKAFSLVELMCVVAIISILASVAIPGFVKYVKQARSAEAVTNLRTIFDAEVAHYYRLYSKANRNGSLVFNLNAPSCGNFTTGPNCYAFTYSNAYDASRGIGLPPQNGNKVKAAYYPDPMGNGASYDANPNDWYKSFPSLGVSFDSPIAYAYVVNLGVWEVNALCYNPSRYTYESFYADAYGDLDGDGILSTYRRIGYVDTNAEVVGGGGIYIDQGLE